MAAFVHSFTIYRHTYIHSYIQYIRSTEETLQESIATVATSQSQQVQDVRYEVVFLF